ncbi:siphovirus ReqiPepy6 Gp37-like family protein [Paractinoplanes rishiriensis]|uniref:Gp28/Gp37-like domain-containing protein n=1 Tax=Paractinoplanes rishiriensis TaxID=1050105 RepID=A0A919N2W3_9ACTN|nr:siphovirus ReqiPepy6 Gp37-like family protein [Actinoplanes rishiriensis]GIF02233.1 hypothetical protein Ari01nite_96970 [Actinoplanes rishiriensis]
MRLSDVTVEVRTKNLERAGLIRPEDLDLAVSDVFNNVGTWTIKLPSEHPLAGVLRTPGAGIIVTGPTDVLMSGPVITPENAATATDPAGTLTITGVSDMILLADTLAWPDPANPDPTRQTVAYDTRTGPVETLMHQYVAVNLGPAAPPVRRTAALPAAVVLGVDGGRGPIVTKSARFPVLGHLLAELATVAELGFRMVQRGDRIVFETYPVVDRSRLVRLDIRNSTLAGHKVATSPPRVTHVLVAGQDEGVQRQFVLRTNPAAAAAEVAWGRRIERFVDQRNTDNLTELEQAGDEVLADEGFAALAVQAVPAEDSSMPFGPSWGLGDKVTVVVEDQELSSTVTGYTLKADRDGFRLGALIGDTTGFDPQTALAKRVTSVETRVSQLERNAESNPAGLRIIPSGSLAGDAGPEHYPPGETLMYLSPAVAEAGNWHFRNTWGYVRTTGDGGNDVYQTFATISPGPGQRTEYWIRSANAPAGWSPWRQIVMHDEID